MFQLRAAGRSSANLCTVQILRRIGACSAGKLQVFPDLMVLCLPACLQDLKFSVHTHPTLSEVLDELIKTSHVEAPAQKRPEPKVLDPKLKELQPLPA